MTLKIGVLVSGRGSNLEAVLASGKRGDLGDASVAVVVSNRPGVPALEIARAYGVPSEVIEGKGVARDEHDRLVIESLRRHGVDSETGLVLLAGYLRIIGKEFAATYHNRIMNIHPSILPSFPGLDAQAQALQYGVRVTGCTVHFVVPEVDTGPIILQKAVEVEEMDTVESLSEKVLKEEHLLFPRAVKLFAEGKLTIAGRRVLIKA